jgi:hypothetical protein
MGLSVTVLVLVPQDDSEARVQVPVDCLEVIPGSCL